MRDRLIDFINARLARYEGQRDAAGILDEALRTAAVRLLELVGSQTTDVDAVVTVARVFWLRYLLLPEGQDQADLRQALVLYRAIHEVRPEAVPDELRAAVSADPDDLVTRVFTSLAADFGAAVNEGDQQKISASIQKFRQLLDMLPSSHPQRAQIAATLAVAHGSLYGFTSDPADLDAEITILQSTVTVSGLSASELAFQHLFLGEAHEKRYDRFQRMTDLDAAIKARKESLRLTEADNEDRGERAYHLGKLLLVRANRSRAWAGLDAAIDVLEMACSAEGVGRDRGVWSHSLADAFLGRYNHMYRPADLNAAILAYRAAYEIFPAGSPRRSAYLMATARALEQRFALLGEISDCDAAIELLQEAASGQPGIEVPAGLRGALHAGLGLTLTERYLAAGDIRDLLTTVEAFRTAASQSRPDPQLGAQALCGLGKALSLLLRLTADGRHRAEAIRAYAAVAEASLTDSTLRDRASAACARLGQRIEDVPVPESVVRCAELSDEAALARDRYWSGGELNELNRAITFTRLLLPLASSADADHVSYLVLLGEDLLERYERTGWVTDAHQALATAKQAEESATDRRSLAAALCTVANAWLAIHRITREAEALENAIAAAGRSVEETPADEPGRAWSHNALGISLMRRSEETFGIADALRAAEELRKALAILPSGSARRASVLNNLAAALRGIYDHDQDVSVLSESIDVLRTAHAEGAASLAGLANLGNAYMNRYRITADTADADRARKAYLQALEGLSPSDARYDTITYGLCEAVLSEPRPAPEITRQAAQYVTKLIDDHAPADGMWHHRLGMLLRETFTHSGNIQDAQRAVEAFRRAVELTSYR